MRLQQSICQRCTLIVSQMIVHMQLLMTSIVTFVKISLEKLDIVWKAENSAIHISLPSGLRMDNNNLGGKFHRTLTSIRIPTVSLKVLSNVTSHHNNWLENASISTDISLDIYSSPAGWRTLAEDQLNFVDEQDALTGRAAAMFQALWGDRIRDKRKLSLSVFAILSHIFSICFASKWRSHSPTASVA